MMPIRVSRGELQTALATVKPGVSSKDLIQQSSCYVFQDGWVVTFDGEIACRTRTPLPEDFRGAVHAAPLEAVLENIRDDFIQLDMKDGELVVTAYAEGSRKAVGIRMESEILLPIEEIQKPDRWETISNPEEWSNAVATVKQTTGKDDEEFLTVVIHVHPDHLESCDRKQITRYKVRTPVEQPILVRKKYLEKVGEIRPHKLAETDNWVHFKTGQGNSPTLIYSCRRHVELFPAIDDFIEFEGDKAILPEGTVTAAKLAEIFSSEDKDNNRVMVTLAEGRMVVTGEGSFGWAEEELRMPYHGERLQFRIAPELLIKLITDRKENCEIGRGKLKVVGNNWIYVTVLASPKKEESSGRGRKRKADREPVEAGSQERS